MDARPTCKRENDTGENERRKGKAEAEEEAERGKEERQV